jgi:anti-anti-sigma regulatory factor
MAVEVRRTPDTLQLELTGEWGARQFTAIQSQLAAVDLTGAHRVLIASDALEVLELSAAWALREFVQRARTAGIEVAFRGQRPTSCVSSMTP